MQRAAREERERAWGEGSQYGVHKPNNAGNTRTAALDRRGENGGLGRGEAEGRAMAPCWAHRARAYRADEEAHVGVEMEARLGAEEGERRDEQHEPDGLLRVGIDHPREVA